jgi:hypothetical protein
MIRVFEGMATNYDSSDIKPGVSEIQINCNGYKRGEISVRRGLREIEFTDDED